MRLFSIRARILAVFALMLAAFVAALVYNLVQLRQIGESIAVLDEGYLPLAEVAADLEAVGRQLDRDYERLARAPTGPIEGHRRNAEDNSARLASGVEAGRQILTQVEVADAEELRAVGDVITAFDRVEEARLAFDTAAAAWLGAQEAGGDTGASVADLARRSKELITALGNLSGLIEDRIGVLSERTARAQSNASTVGGALTGLSMLLAGGLVWVALLTLRPIGQLTSHVQRLAAGEQAGRLDASSADEVGVLAREFNAMVDAVAERDRTLKERAEALDRLSERLRSVLDTIRAGLLVVLDGRVQMANPAALDLWGLEEGQDLPSELDLPVGRHDHLELAERKLNVDVVAFGERGRLIVGEDVTERIRDRERLARSQRLALVGQMLAQITHEVRNPLNAMSLNAELLSEEVTDPEAAAMLATITTEISRLEAVTQRYLDMSRRREVVPTSEDPLELARSVVHLEEEALRRAGVQASVDGASPGVVEIDGDALRRALRNLVRNAVEAGAHRIGVTVGSGDGLITLVVADDGPGMDPAQVKRAFEPFFTTKAKGTGLGLAITRQEIEDLGGTLSCRSEPGQGTTIILGIPAPEE